MRLPWTFKPTREPLSKRMIQGDRGAYISLKWCLKAAQMVSTVDTETWTLVTQKVMYAERRLAVTSTGFSKAIGASL